MQLALIISLNMPKLVTKNVIAPGQVPAVRSQCGAAAAVGKTPS